MKFSKLYSNDDNLFKPITFNDGLNVIMGIVTEPKYSDSDSHNLGKSLLIDVIDFCLLKSIRKESFVKKLPKKLQDLELYLEIVLNNGNFVTIKRSFTKNTKISFFESRERYIDCRNKRENDWDFFSISLKTSQRILDGYLGIDIISPFDYRKGISYFLRKQSDYLDVFQISKFAKNNHLSWKPYIGLLLGINYQSISNKYIQENELNEKKNQLEILKSELILPNDPQDKIKARAEAEEEIIKEFEEKLDLFDFQKKDIEISEIDLKEIEEEISYLNNEIYNFRIDLTEINSSLSKKISFKIENIKKIFSEISLSFNEGIVKEYNELIQFNRNLTKDREKRLNLQKTKIEAKLIEIKNRLNALNIERSKYLSLITEKDSILKYKKFQNNLVISKTNLEKFRRDLATFNKVNSVTKEFREKEQSLISAIEKLSEEIAQDSDTLKKIRQYFRSAVTKVLSIGALLYVEMNANNNLEFKALYTKDKGSSSPTSESDGTSYKKLLCSFFDIAVLQHYHKSNFYHFVYHDGILEGLHDNRKINLIELIRSICNNFNIQYILTAIDSDLPYINGSQFAFEDNEIIRTLTDSGEQGRLFNSSTF